MTADPGCSRTQAVEGPLADDLRARRSAVGSCLNSGSSFRRGPAPRSRRGKIRLAAIRAIASGSQGTSEDTGSGLERFDVVGESAKVESVCRRESGGGRRKDIRTALERRRIRADLVDAEQRSDQRDHRSEGNEPAARERVLDSCQFHGLRWGVASRLVCCAAGVGSGSSSRDRRSGRRETRTVGGRVAPPASPSRPRPGFGGSPGSHKRGTTDPNDHPENDDEEQQATFFPRASSLRAARAGPSTRNSTRFPERIRCCSWIDSTTWQPRRAQRRQVPEPREPSGHGWRR